MHRSDHQIPPAPSDEPINTNAPVVGDGPGEDVPGGDLQAEGITTDGASFRGDVVNVVRGICMGAADTVPGVSGGTVALILGHYQRLVTAISHIDSALLSLVVKSRYREAAMRVDLRFLVALGIGIVFGIAAFAGLMHWLLDHRMSETLAVFLGLVLASVWVVKNYIDRWSASRWGACFAGVAVAAAIAVLPTSVGDPSLPYLFLSASVAICAMILPGISGAFVLLLFGVYYDVTGLIKELVQGEFSIDALVQLSVFAVGCLFGLLAFSRLLRWLLEHRRGATMAGLMGLMIGSVGKLWPLQSPTAETAGLKAKERVLEYVAPSDWPGSLALLIVLVIASAAAVLAVEKFANREMRAS